MKPTYARLFTLGLLVGPPAYSDSGGVDKTLTDPTKPPVQAVVAKVHAVPDQIHTLTSILIGQQRKLAVIDGNTMSEGDTYNGIRLVKVNSDSVDVRTIVRLSAKVTRLHLTPANRYKEAH